MIPRCWEILRQEDLIHYDICNCETECRLKSAWVDELLKLWESDGIELAAVASRIVQRSFPAFKES